MFNKIMFATTGTPACDHAAHVAFDLAKKYKSQLDILHIFGVPSRGFSQSVVDLRTGEEETLNQDYTSWVVEEIRNTYEKQIKEYGNCKIIANAGIPYTEILRQARKDDVDLIVMGAHNRDEEEVGATRFREIVGSTMQKVSKSARCPVLIVSRPCTTCLWYFSNIIFATDFSKASDSAFTFALNLAQEIGAKLHMFHALDLSVMHAGKTIAQTEIEQKINEAKKKMEEKYVSKLNGYDNYDIEIWEGIPYVEILKFSRDKNGDLIVMAHHTKEVDPEKAILGSIIEQVVLRASCPVASVNKPDKADLHAQQ
jgi:nucleotide-binding universal stress UspA family protein